MLKRRDLTYQSVGRFRGKIDAALASCDRAIAMRPDHVEACRKHGNLLYLLNRFAESVASYDRAIALRPDHAEAHANRGISLHAMKRYEEALKTLVRAAVTLNKSTAKG